MRVFCLTLWVFVFMLIKSASGQCPDRDSVLNKVVPVNHPGPVNYAEELKQLLAFETKFSSCPNRVDSAYTFLLLRIGVMYYKLADYSHAVQYTLKALEMIQLNAANPAINKSSLIRYYYYLSIYYDSLKMPVERNMAIDSCISNELRVNSNYHFTSLVLESNVMNLFEKGDYTLCAERAALGEMLIHKYYRISDSADHVIFFMYYHASALRMLKKFSEEEEFLLSKKKEFANSRTKIYEGIIYNLFGYLYESKGDYVKAIQYFLKAYDLDRQSAKKEISAEVLSKTGEIYSEKFGQYKIALNYFHLALACAQNKKLSNASVSDSFYIWGNVANVYVRMGLFDSAFYFFQKAFDRIKKGMNENDLSKDMENYVNANKAEQVLKLVLNKANAYLQQYYYSKKAESLVQALAIYKTADHLLTKIMDGQAEIKSRLFWETDAHILYEHAIEASYLQNDFNEAFYFFEKSRAVLLSEQLNQQNKYSASNISNLAQLRRKILSLEKARDTAELSSGRYIEIQMELIVSNQALHRMELTLEKDNPVYYQNILDTNFITIHDVQKKILTDHQGLLEIFSGDSAVYSLLITPGPVYFNKVNKRDFDSTAADFISYISNPALLNSRFNEFKLAAHQLYQLIFKNNVIPRGRIIISPDGQIFPFEALITNTNTGSPEYFLKDYAVSYTYSARYLLVHFNSEASGQGNNFLGLAPVNYASGLSFASLQGSDLSLDEIGSYFDYARNLTGNAATRNNFQKQYSDYKIIQIYSHASDNSIQSEPVIYFADSSLYLSDLIPENKPRTRLIVLSACETANGILYRGEGVFGFNRGFASMGIPASITNLWSVDNRSTYRVTELFYKYLAGGLPVDVALQKAKLEFIQYSAKENKLPFYWAATILAGRSDKIILNKNFPWKDLLIITCLAGLSVLVYQKGKTAGKTKFHKQGIKS